MNGRGAVEIIIAGIGLHMGIIDRDIFSILVFMAIFTTMTVPVLLKWTTNWLKRRGELVLINKREGILILGANPISLLLARTLKEQTSLVIIDSNQDIVNQTREKGFNCIYGNALKEDVMSGSGADNMNTVIAATPNTEVNILAAQLASESFQVPNTHILISKGKNIAGMDVIKFSQATSLFASGIDIDFWFGKISNGDFTEMTGKVTEKYESRTWMKTNRDKNEVLPLFIENTEGVKRIFHFGDVIYPHEIVHYLTSSLS